MQLGRQLVVSLKPAHLLPLRHDAENPAALRCGSCAFVVVATSAMVGGTAWFSARTLRRRPASTAFRGGRRQQLALQAGSRNGNNASAVMKVPLARPRRWSDFQFERHSQVDGGRLKQTDSLPRLLYLPGLDGDGAYTADFEFDSLAESYDVWRLRIGPKDRTLFAGLEDAVCEFMSAGPPGATLVGESFGGLLALAVATRLEQKRLSSHDNYVPTDALIGVVVINSATAFEVGAGRNASSTASDNSRNDNKGAASALASAAPYLRGQSYALAAGSALPLSFLDARTIGGYVARLLQRPSEAVGQVADTVGLIGRLLEELPQETLKFRVEQWLQEGKRTVKDANLRTVNTPVLLLAGGQDALLPSAEEAHRLAALLPAAQVTVLPFCGHALFFPYGNELDKLTGNMPSPSLKELIDGASWNLGLRAYELSLARDNPNVKLFLQQEGSPLRVGPIDLVPFLDNGQADDVGDNTATKVLCGKKPALIFVPGIAGSGAGSAAAQFPALSEDFQCFRCEARQELPSFAALADAICAALAALEAPSDKLRGGETLQERDVLLVGESFGGLMALAVAARLQQQQQQQQREQQGQTGRRPVRCQGVVVVNPATSYSTSDASELGPVIEAVPDVAFPGLLRAFFLANSLDGYQAQQLFQDLQRQLEKIDGQQAGNALRFLGRLLSPTQDSLGLTKKDLKRRLAILTEGCSEVDAVLSELQCPVLAVCGAEDRLQPSAAEARRLERLLPNCVATVLEGRGHALLGDGRLSLVQLLRRSPRLRPLTTPAEAANFQPPTLAAFEEAAQLTDRFDAAVSPVWLSKGADGRPTSGLESLRELLLPTGMPAQPPAATISSRSERKRPVVFVGYHQRYALDVATILCKFYREFGIFLRGLTHPEVMSDRATQDVPRQFLKWVDIGLRGREAVSEAADAANQDDLLTSPSLSSEAPAREAERRALDEMNNNTFAKFGAVPVSARNFVRLLQAGENVLLFPGGVREAFHLKGEEYQLFWPPEPEFVRAVARYGGTIVPFASVGAAETVPLLLDQQELDRVPMIGKNLRQVKDGRLRVREGEAFSPPLGVPTPPERFYFLFGSPLDLSGIDSRDRQRCGHIYSQIQSEIASQLNALREWRTEDPYRDALPRWLFQASNSGKEVPTFPLEGKVLK